jgi:hypothetical protein
MYRIIPGGERGWIIDRNGAREGDYATKEAAFEAAVGAASSAIHQGLGVTITVEARGAGEANLGHA